MDIVYGKAVDITNARMELNGYRQAIADLVEVIQSDEFETVEQLIVLKLAERLRYKANRMSSKLSSKEVETKLDFDVTEGNVV